MASAANIPSSAVSLSGQFGQEAKAKDVGGKPGKSAGPNSATAGHRQQPHHGGGGGNASGRHRGGNGRSNKHNYPSARNKQYFNNGSAGGQGGGGNRRAGAGGTADLAAGQEEFSSSSSGGKQRRRQVAMDDESEVGSIFNSGSKKQSLNHLLNFNYGTRSGAADNQRGHRGNRRSGYNNRNSQQYGGGRGAYQRGHGGGRNAAGCAKKTKEHYLQANCQFLVKDVQDYMTHTQDPDSLVEWDHIEQVHLKTGGSEPTSCPICLFPPTAAKMARCGHVFCWPCILHYLALSDDEYRPCPICYCSVYKEELKSVLVVPQATYHTGTHIEMQLMRRDRNSLFASPVLTGRIPPHDKFPTLKDLNVNEGLETCWTNVNTMYAKLITASKQEVLDRILARERLELEMQFAEEKDQPEAVFIEQALSLLAARENAVWPPSVAIGLPVAKLNSPPGAVFLNEDANDPGQKDQAKDFSSPEATSPIDVERMASSVDYWDYAAAPSKTVSLTEVEAKPEKTGEVGELVNDLDNLLLDDQVNNGATSVGDKPMVDDQVIVGGDDDVLARHASSSSEDAGEAGLEAEIGVVTADDLDISSVQPTNMATVGDNKKSPKNTFYFYQSCDGQPIFLHALNVQMLVHEYGSLENCPNRISARILEKDASTMTEDMRDRLRYLRHLPLASSFEVAELDLSTGCRPEGGQGRHLVTRETLASFADDLSVRARRRARKRRYEKRREKRIQVEEMRIMGRYPGPMVRIESEFHYPKIGATAAQAPPDAESSDRRRLRMSSETLSVGAGSETSDGDLNASMSPQETNAGGLNFSQIIRDGKARPAAAARAAPPTPLDDPLIRSAMANSSMTIRRRLPNSESDQDESAAGAAWVAPPQRSNLGDAIASALAKAGEQKDSSSGSEPSTGKKKGKKKGKIILYGGGPRMPCI